MAEKSRRQDRLILSAPLPPSVNHLYRTGADGKRYMTKEGREFKKEVAKEVMVAGGSKKCPPPPFALHLHLRLPDALRRDASNLVKALEDAIFAQLGHDDSLVYDLHIWKYVDRSDPGVTVEIRHTDRKLEVAV